jgi:hypothetical protein
MTDVAVLLKNCEYFVRDLVLQPLVRQCCPTRISFTQDGLWDSLSIPRTAGQVLSLTARTSL